MKKGDLYIERWMGNVSQTKTGRDIVRVIDVFHYPPNVLDLGLNRTTGYAICRYYNITRDRRQISVKADNLFESRYVKYKGE